MAAYRRVYDSRHLQADCQAPGSAPEPYARQSSMGYLYFFIQFNDSCVIYYNFRHTFVRCIWRGEYRRRRSAVCWRGVDDDVDRTSTVDVARRQLRSRGSSPASSSTSTSSSSSSDAAVNRPPVTVASTDASVQTTPLRDIDVKNA